MLKLAGELLEGQLADHIARLDAHTYELGQKLRTGEYYGFRAGSGTADPITADTLYAIPFHVARDFTIDRIAIEIYTLAAGKSARLGIYNDGTNLYPGSLVVDAGEVSAATTGVKAITISESLTKGLYWLALVSDGTPSPMTSNRQAQPHNVMGIKPTDLRYPYTLWSVSFTYAALPDPFTGGGSLSDYTYPPIVLLRIASLD